MILGHLTGNDLSSAALTFGLAFLFMAWRQRAGNRRRAVRLLAGAIASLGVATIAGFVHPS